MKHQKKGKTLGRTKEPREALMRSLATSFFLHGKLRTTKVKTKALRPMVEKLITLGKKDVLHHRRQALQVLYDEAAIKKLFEVYGPKYKERKGGYTRITKLPTRLGDGAEMAVLELVD